MQHNGDESLTQAIERLEARLAALEEQNGSGEHGSLGDALKARTDEFADAIVAFIERHPVRAATIAFLLGVVLASRRGGR